MKAQSHSGNLDAPIGLRWAGQWPCPQVTEVHGDQGPCPRRHSYVSRGTAPGTQERHTLGSCQDGDGFDLGVHTLELPTGPGLPSSDPGNLDDW